MDIGFVFNRKKGDSINEAEFDTDEVIESITKALESNGDKVIPVEMTRDGLWINELKRSEPDLIFNTAEGFHGIGRESLAPTVFEQLQIPYVGSGPYACFLTLDKYLTKKVIESKGVNTPSAFFISAQSEIKVIAEELQYPVFVKPNFEGSSKGITQRSRCEDAPAFVSFSEDSIKQFPEGLLVERFIEGRDLTVPYIHGLGNGGALEPVEYTGTEINGHAIYDYEMKNLRDEEIGIKCPAVITGPERDQLLKNMQIVVSALGVFDMSRADFRITENGEIYFIEVNPLPSLQPGAGLFASSNLLGLDYNQTIQAILNTSLERQKVKGKAPRSAFRTKQRKPKVALVYNVKRLKPGDPGYETEAEFDSMTTIDAIGDVILELKYPLQKIEADRDLPSKLRDFNIDVVFNIAEGLHKQSREAQVPAICDLLGVEHTGSDAACLGITLNKSVSSRLVISEGISAPRSIVIYPAKIPTKHNLNYPLIVKPNLEGTSKGIYDSSVVENEKDFLSYLNNYFKANPKDPMLVEEYIVGREFTVGVAGNLSLQIIGITEIVFKNKNTPFPVYSYEAKQLDNQLDNKIFKMQSPPDISKNLEMKIHSFAKRVFKITGCRDIARIDFKVTENEKLYFIEVNPLPGLSPGFSDLTIMAEKNGIPYSKLIGKILKPAVSRWRKQV